MADLVELGGHAPVADLRGVVEWLVGHAEPDVARLGRAGRKVGVGRADVIEARLSETQVAVDAGRLGHFGEGQVGVLAHQAQGVADGVLLGGVEDDEFVRLAVRRIALVVVKGSVGREAERHVGDRPARADQDRVDVLLARELIAVQRIVEALGDQLGTARPIRVRRVCRPRPQARRVGEQDGRIEAGIIADRAGHQARRLCPHQPTADLQFTRHLAHGARPKTDCAHCPSPPDLSPATLDAARRLSRTRRSGGSTASTALWC